MEKGIHDLHSVLRYVIILLFIYAIFRCVNGMKGKNEFGNADKKAGLFLTIALDIQLLLGLFLYFKNKFYGLPMGDSVTRYWKIEHITGMIIAIVIAHVGNVMMKKKKDSHSKFKAGLVYFIISLVIILATIPWPFRIEGISRPLFPGM